MNKKVRFRSEKEDFGAAAVIWGLFLFIGAVSIYLTAKKHDIGVIECLRKLVSEEGIQGKVLLPALFAIPFIMTMRCLLSKVKRRIFLGRGLPVEADIVDVIRKPKRADRLIVRLPDGQEIKSDGFYMSIDTFYFNKCTVYELNGKYIVSEIYNKRS
ncbi:MAG: hypothetical protein K6G82_01485 [Ruminococcus sp.]|nr:hypothetical protein [Ruminococcus sp.]